MGSDNAIEVEGLTKLYRGPRGKPPKRALDGIDLAIPTGSLFALLGPNGAGKSTFINILAGLVTKTSGRAAVCGWDIDAHTRNAKAALGVVPQEIYFDAFFTPREMLEIQAGLYGVPARARRTDELLAAVHLSDKADAYSRSLSGGMKRRLLVAKAMVHDPPVLILDEPTAGVDIELRQQLWAYVRRLHARGVTVVLTTHYLEEAEELCDRIAIIDHGRLVACDDKRALLSRVAEKEVTVRLETVPAGLEEALAQLGQCRREGDDLTVQYDSSRTDVGAILEAIAASGAHVRDLSTRETDLEDIFLQLTAKAA